MRGGGESATKMRQVVVDTDIASYIFNWHPSAQGYVDALRGSELILSFMSIAEMRMGAIAAGWGVRRRTLLERRCGPPGRLDRGDGAGARRPAGH